MIETVRCQNVKVLRQVEVDLQRLTVFVGPNASGKTSILEALDYTVRASKGTEESLCAIADELWNLTRSGAPAQIVLCAHSSEGTVWVGFHGPHFDPFGGAQTAVSFRKDGKEYILKRLMHGAGLLAPDREGRPAEAFLRLDPRKLASASYSEEPTPRMEPDGHGLPSVLAYLATTRPEDYAALLSGLREVIPIVQAMRFPRAAVVRPVSEIITVDGKPYTHHGEKTFWGNSIEFDVLGGRSIPASRVSEGTLLVLGILTAVLGPARPRLLLLDDVDRALHPKAQKDLVALLRKLMEANPELQIVATSHSPYLLDHLKPEEVRLTTLREDGSAACARLQDHPEFEKWKDEMSPGEFWSTVGEKWVADVGPEAGKEKQG